MNDVQLLLLPEVASLECQTIPTSYEREYREGIGIRPLGDFDAAKHPVPFYDLVDFLTTEQAQALSAACLGSAVPSWCGEVTCIRERAWADGCYYPQNFDVHFFPSEWVHSEDLNHAYRIHRPILAVNIAENGLAEGPALRGPSRYDLHYWKRQSRWEANSSQDLTALSPEQWADMHRLATALVAAFPFALTKAKPRQPKPKPDAP